MTATLDRATRLYDVVLPARASRAEWLTARRAGIGGSDAPVIVGAGGFSTQLDVYAEKIGVDMLDRDSETMLIGRELEDPIARLWQRKNPGLYVRRGPALLRSTRWPWMLASVDRNVWSAPRGGRHLGILECKNRSQWADGAWEDTAPADVVVQTLHYLAVTGAPRAFIGCLVGGSEVRCYEVPRDEDLIADLAEDERQWWERHVAQRALPPLEGGQQGRVLAALHPADPDLVKRADPDLALLVRECREAKDAAREAQQRADALADRVRLALGTAVAVVTDDGGKSREIATWKPSSTTRVDVAHLAEAHPAAHADSLRTTQTRTLLVKKAALT